ncbi:MAG: aminotransferase class V-fold PLP-dependent enzyme [Miltoncostaeaceae bacterium]
MTAPDRASEGDARARWQASARAALPSLATEAYLNTGGAGPLPTPAVEAMREMIALQASRGRMSAAAVDAGRQRQAAVRCAVGRVLGRPAGEIAIAQSSTHAMNAVIWGLDLMPGDELVTTGMEHPGLAVPLAAAARRSGAVLRVVDVGDGSGSLEDVVRTACSPRTRLVALSHVSWLTGAVLDVRGAATAAHEVGAVVLVDGAQAAGAIAVDPVALGADAYAMPAQKWLLGPEGLGALWVSDAARDRLSVVFSGYETGTDHGWDGSLTMHADARRFEASTHPEILLTGWAASIEWLEGLGWDAVHAATAAAARACRRALDGTDGAQVDPPRTSGSGLVAFSVPGVAPEVAAAALAGRGVIVRPLPAPGQLRASCAFFTDTDDINQLTEALGTLVAC